MGSDRRAQRRQGEQAQDWLGDILSGAQLSGVQLLCNPLAPGQRDRAPGQQPDKAGVGVWALVWLVGI